MGKLPWFQFYPKDWREDPVLQVCSRTAKSVWLDMLCLMFFAPIRGVCSSGDGIPWTDQQIAAAIGGDIGTNVACIHELVSQGVASRNERGAIYSRRMVRDESERKKIRDRVARWRASKTNIEAPCALSNVTPVVTQPVTPVVMPLYGDGIGNSSSCIDTTETKDLFTNNYVRAQRAPPKKRKTFSPPSPEEVATYCAERHNSVNPDAWFGYYQSNGWKVGRNSMKDWKAAVRYWETNSNGHYAKSSNDYDIHREVEKAKRSMAARGTG